MYKLMCRKKNIRISATETMSVRDIVFEDIKAQGKTRYFDTKEEANNVAVVMNTQPDNSDWIIFACEVEDVTND